MSKDQLQLMYGMLQSKISAVKYMIKAIQNTNATDIVRNPKKAYKQTEQSARSNMTHYMNSTIECLRDQSPNVNCQSYDQNRRMAIESLLVEAQAFSTYQYANYLNTNDFIGFLEQEQASLQTQFNKVQALLGGSIPFLGGLIDSAQLAVENMTNSYLDDQWLQFDYDYDSYSLDEKKQSTTESIKASARFGGWFWGGSASYSYNKNTTDYRQKLAQSKMKAKGELLRVNIKRPWFKPELFEIPSLSFVSV